MDIHTILLFLLAAQAAGPRLSPGLKISERSSYGERFERQHTTYLESDRRRTEYRTNNGNVDGPPLAFISRCDLDQNLELNLDDREYSSRPIPNRTGKEELEALAAKVPHPVKPPDPTILVEITTVDTGDRKRIFGYDARRVITTRKQTNLNRNANGDRETVTDGWYTDLSTTLSCEPKPSGRTVGILTSHTAGQPFDVPTVKFVGPPESGFALSTRTTSQDTNISPDGSTKVFTSNSETEVTELSSEPLDSALFEVPKGFTKVDQIQRNAPVTLALRVQQYWDSFKFEVARYFHR